MFIKCTILSIVGRHSVYRGPGNRLTALAVLAALVVSSVALASPFQVLKVENAGRYIQIGVHMLAPADGIPHAINLPGVWWATPYMWAGAPAAAVTGTSQHLIALHAGEAVPGPLHTYALTAVPTGPPAIPPIVAAYARLWHGGALPPNDNHPDIFVEVLAANLNAAVFVDIGVHDPPPGTCSGLASGPDGQEMIPPTPSEAVAASTLVFYLPDNTLSLGLVVEGINQADVVSSAIHLGAAGSNGPVIFDLGPGAVWNDLGGIGIGRIIEDALVPAGIC